MIECSINSRLAFSSGLEWSNNHSQTAGRSRFIDTINKSNLTILDANLVDRYTGSPYVEPCRFDLFVLRNAESSREFTLGAHYSRLVNAVESPLAKSKVHEE